MKFEYKNIRQPVLAVVAFGGIFAAFAAAYALAGAGRQGIGITVIVLAAIGLWIARREEQVIAWRSSARNQLDALRTEVSNAQTGSGENYTWFKDVPYRPAFETLVYNTRDQIGSLELQAQEIERRMKARRLWQSTRSIIEGWQVVEFEAHRTVQSLTDHLWWSQAGSWDPLANAMAGDEDKRRPKLKLVVNRK